RARPSMGCSIHCKDIAPLHCQAHTHSTAAFMPPACLRLPTELFKVVAPVREPLSMWSFRAWRQRRILARSPYTTQHWQQVRQRLALLDGLSEAEEQRLFRRA